MSGIPQGLTALEDAERRFAMAVRDAVELLVMAGTCSVQDAPSFLLHFVVPKATPPSEHDIDSVCARYMLSRNDAHRALVIQAEVGRLREVGHSAVEAVEELIGRVQRAAASQGAGMEEDVPGGNLGSAAIGDSAAAGGPASVGEGGMPVSAGAGAATAPTTQVASARASSSAAMPVTVAAPAPSPAAPAAGSQSAVAARPHHVKRPLSDVANEDDASAGHVVAGAGEGAASSKRPRKAR